MIPGLLLAPFGLIIPAIIRFIVYKKPLSKFAAGIIVFLNLIAIITAGILIIHGVDERKITPALSIAGAISSLIAFKMLIKYSEDSMQNIKTNQNK